MLIQSSFPTSIGESLSFGSKFGVGQNSEMVGLHNGGTLNSSPNCDNSLPDDNPISVASKEVERINASGPRIQPTLSTPLPPVETAYASSGPQRSNFVYRRRKQHNGCDGNNSSATPQCSSFAQQEQKCTYTERKREVSLGDLPCHASTMTCGPPISQKCDVVFLSPTYRPKRVGATSKSNPVIEGSVREDTISNRKTALQCCSSANDSCCSSKSKAEHGSALTKRQADNAGECSSSDFVAAELFKGLPVRDACISSQPRASADDVLGIYGDGPDCFQSCKICGALDNRLNMLICDLCEEAFHLPCCNPRMKSIAFDEWYCHSCIKKKPKPLLEVTKKGKVVNAYRKKLSGSGQISLMVRDTEPYTSGARIGKSFQAEVPEWSGPIYNDTDIFGEPVEIDPSECANLNSWNSNQSTRHDSIGNWIQCRATVYDGVKETVCGKWRRAPIFEVQTDDWDCSCAVVWDPVHADCAVPQELATQDVMTHLKYVEMLRPRFTGKKRKAADAGKDGHAQ